MYYWIHHFEYKQRVCFDRWPYCTWTHQIHTNHEPGIKCQILLFWIKSAHFSYEYAPSLLFDILDKWNINNQYSTSCVRPCHVMLFLIVFSVLVCTGWSNISCYQDSTLYSLSQWLRNLDLVCYLCSREDHTLQYVVLSNEVGLSPFLFIAVMNWDCKFDITDTVVFWSWEMC
jgi:hypothetical protein